jgi:hypothetical protein
MVYAAATNPVARNNDKGRRLPPPPLNLNEVETKVSEDFKNEEIMVEVVVVAFFFASSVSLLLCGFTSCPKSLLREES